MCPIKLGHLRGDLHAVEIAKFDRPQRARVKPTPKSDHSLVVAEPRDIHPHDERIIDRDLGFVLGRACGLDQIARDELHGPGPREFALDADADEIQILAVVSDPLGKFRLVGHAGRAAVDLPRRPAMMKLPAGKAGAEAADIAGRVAEHGPQNFRALVCQRAFRCLPDDVRDGRAFIEDDDDALALIVQSRERFGVVFAPRDAVDPPCIFMLGIG